MDTGRDSPAVEGAAADEQRLRAFMARYDAGLRSIVIRRLGRHNHGVDDVVQAAYIALWHKQRQLLHSPEDAWAFVRTVALNHIRDEQDRAESKRVDRTATMPDTPGREPDPADAVVLAEMGRAAAHAYQALTPCEQSVWALCQWAGFSQMRVARELGITRKAVERALARARRKMREHLGPLVAGIAAPGWIRRTRPQPASPMLAVPACLLAGLACMVIARPAPHRADADRVRQDAPRDVVAAAAVPRDPDVLRRVSAYATPRAARLPAESLHGEPPGRKVRGCLRTSACLNDRAGPGTVLWVALPAPPGSSPERHEVWIYLEDGCRPAGLARLTAAPAVVGCEPTPH